MEKKTQPFESMYSIFLVKNGVLSIDMSSFCGGFFFSDLQFPHLLFRKFGGRKFMENLDSWMFPP